MGIRADQHTDGIGTMANAWLRRRRTVGVVELRGESRLGDINAHPEDDVVQMRLSEPEIETTMFLSQGSDNQPNVETGEPAGEAVS